MGKKSRGGANAGNPGKRSRPEDNRDSATAAKKLLDNNRFSVLKDGSEPVMETTGPPKKDRMPPFYGVRYTIQLCTEGYKLMVPALKYYKAVKTILDQSHVEYFSHDIETVKPLKVVLRGLNGVLLEELVSNGLKPVQIHKMARHNKAVKYHDQLYLVHLEKNSTTLMDLQDIRVLEVSHSGEVGAVQASQPWNCLLFGHGTKNFHMVSRCIKCGKQHKTDACNILDEADPICANFGAAHKATSKACPKRAEYIEIRKKHRRKTSLAQECARNE
ncbi:uncharacterized protein LOC135712779 [Ochlerotatus camptorhynchus]|uniref:uncharacterized protein LOC135712779 n=1 Tax=Ochlerotatus camptorhynchus TaxID=644619 RepID=UPI0031D8CFBB